MGIIIGRPLYPDKMTVPPDAGDRRAWLANKIMHEVSEM
jgi:hypothetical protein